MGALTTVDPDVAAFVAGGVAVVVATRDDALRPEIARGWGPLVAPDGAAATLCVGLHPGSRARANLEANGAIAATFSLPTTYRGVQIKGVARALREPRPTSASASRRTSKRSWRRPSSLASRPTAAGACWSPSSSRCSSM
jgi:Pyridoxamine 5'-phosphate oxidase